MIAECSSKEETQTLAGKLAQKIPVGSVVALIGNLGTGKTTFTQGFAKGLGITDTVGSPTFKLISEYEGEPLNLYNIYCYRLKYEIDFFHKVKKILEYIFFILLLVNSQLELLL